MPEKLSPFLAIILTVIATICGFTQAQARPVSFPDGWMLMLENNGMENSANLIYSPTAFDAFGFRTEYFRHDATWLHTMTYNRLLKRWNTAQSQANIFLLTGAGIGDDHGDTSLAGFAGISGDWETRRHYLSYETRYIASGANSTDFEQKARIGIAPYIGGYDDWHTWLMLQVQHTPQMPDKITVTPLVRFFNTDVLTEIGYSSNKKILFNLTWQF